MRRRTFLQTLSAMPAFAAVDSELDFSKLIQPVPLRAKFIDERYYIWCGAPVRSDDGGYHLYYSRWPREYGHYAWVTKSEIAHAVAEHPLGPYHHRDVVMPARGATYWDGLCTHNPNIVRIGRQYCLFYMGNTGDGRIIPDLNYSHRNNQRIGVALADHPNGPWKRFDHPVLDANPEPGSFDSLMVSNPAAAAMPGGGVLLVYKGVINDGTPHGRRVRHGVATATSPAGPYKRHPGYIFEANDGSREWMVAEDPYLWHGGDRYWAITRDVVGKFSGSPGGLALFESADGFDWKWAKHPKVLDNWFQWADGTRTNTRIERPALLFDGGKPVALFGAVDVSSKDKPRNHAFNIHIPLAV